MNEDVLVVAMTMGAMVLMVVPIAIYKLSLRSRAMRLDEKRLDMQARQQSDELNARILRMDDFGISPAEIASMREELRQLRQEVSELRQERLIQ